MPRRLSPTLIAFLFFVAFDSLVFYATYLHRKGEFQPITLSEPLPDFKWKDFGGKIHDIQELKGHVVVLHFWASWCPPCREEFPNLLEAAAQNKDIIFLTMSSDEDVEKPKQFLKAIPGAYGIKTPANVLFAWDPERTISYDLFLTVRYPESILIDKKLNRRRKYPVPVDWSNPSVRAYLDELKAEK